MNLQNSPMNRRILQIKQTLGVDVCSLYLAHEEDRSLEIIASCGLDQRVVGTRLSYDQGLTGKVARTQTAVAARDIQNHNDYFHVAGSGEERFKSYLGIPLEFKGDLYGVLVIQTEVHKTFFHREIKELHSAGREFMETLVACTEKSRADRKCTA